jgi:hypothetical protein
MKFQTLTTAAALMALASLAHAQTPDLDNDSMVWSYNYAYTRAICDSSSPKERAMPGKKRCKC